MNKRCWKATLVFLISFPFLSLGQKSNHDFKSDLDLKLKSYQTQNNQEESLIPLTTQIKKYTWDELAIKSHLNRSKKEIEQLANPAAKQDFIEAFKKDIQESIKGSEIHQKRLISTEYYNSVAQLPNNDEFKLQSNFYQNAQNRFEKILFNNKELKSQNLTTHIPFLEGLLFLNKDLEKSVYTEFRYLLGLYAEREKKYKEAFHWYYISALEGKHPEAQLALAYLYYFNQGFDFTDRDAFTFLNRAIVSLETMLKVSPHKKTLFYLGVLKYYIEGFENSEEQALRLLQLATSLPQEKFLENFKKDNALHKISSKLLDESGDIDMEKMLIHIKPAQKYSTKKCLNVFKAFREFQDL